MWKRCRKGLLNLEAHIENMQKFGVPVVVAINRFGTDTDAEIAVLIRSNAQRTGVAVRAVAKSLPRAARAAWTWPRRWLPPGEEPVQLPPHL